TRLFFCGNGGDGGERESQDQRNCSHRADPPAACADVTMTRPGGAMTKRVAVLLAALAVPAIFAQSSRYDVVIRGGQLIDGTGSPRFAGDIAVTNGRIV